MFQVSENPIDPVLLATKLKNQSCGALVTFEGWVRDENEGKSVSGLTYEVYEALAQVEGEKIIEEAIQRFGIKGALIVHRKGELGLKDIAVWIGVTSKHRAAAYKASRYLIDEIKRRLPIWKKEHYVDHNAEWVNCQGCQRHHVFEFSEQQYYEKQLRLVELSESGQKKLKSSRVRVIGAGGLAATVLPYLAGAGVGHIEIQDSDKLEASNLPRQVLFDYDDIGRFKAELAAEKLRALNPFITVDSIITAYKGETIEADLVVDCSDNFATKFNLHDVCYLQKIPLVMASVYRWDGWLQMFSFRDDESCLRCLYPEQPVDGMTMDCANAGVMGTVPAMLGLAQAQAALHALVHEEMSHPSQQLLFNLRRMSIQNLAVPRNPQCPGCSGQKSKGFKYQPQQDFERSWRHLEKLMERNDPPFVIDIRENSEKESVPFLSKWPVLHMPVSQFESVHDFSEDTEMYLVCARGKRSLKQAVILRDQGFKNVFSVEGGVSKLGQAEPGPN